jgi:hypothetical protein
MGARGFSRLLPALDLASAVNSVVRLGLGVRARPSTTYMRDLFLFGPRERSQLCRPFGSGSCISGRTSGGPALHGLAEVPWF